MRRVCFCLISSGAVFSACAATAQDDTGLYGSLRAGAALTNEIDQSIEYPGVAFVAPPPLRQQLDAETGFTFGAALGFRYASGFRTELEYRFTSSRIKERTLSGGPLFVTETSDPDETVQAHFLMSNVYYDFTNSSPVTPYVGVGVGGASVSLGGLGGDDSAFAYQGRAGLNVDLGLSTKIGIEYVYARTRDLDFEAGTGFPAAAELSGSPYVSSSIMATLTKNF